MSLANIAVSNDANIPGTIKKKIESTIKALVKVIKDGGGPSGPSDEQGGPKLPPGPDEAFLWSLKQDLLKGDLFNGTDPGDGLYDKAVGFVGGQWNMLKKLINRIKIADEKRRQQ